MQLIDSHIHLDFDAFDSDRDQLLENAKTAGIRQFILPAAKRSAWQKVAELAKKHAEILPAYGIHPYFIQAHQVKDIDALKQCLDQNPCVAVGETGLDFDRKDLPQDQQIRFFEAQIDIAKERDLPLIMHAHKAVEAVSDLLKKHRMNKGIVHSFNGSYVQAMRLIDRGFMLGFGGAITYPRATRLHALIKQLPLSGICLETDAPDQPSFGFSGKRNEPIALLEILNTLAKLKDIEPKAVAKQSTLNTQIALKI